MPNLSGGDRGKSYRNWNNTVTDRDFMLPGGSGRYFKGHGKDTPSASLSRKLCGTAIILDRNICAPGKAIAANGNTAPGSPGNLVHFKVEVRVKLAEPVETESLTLQDRFQRRREVP